MSKIYRVFIPFIHEEFTPQTVCHRLQTGGLCDVVKIDLHDKKERTQYGVLRSLNHKYAFLEVIPMRDTVQGRNLQYNLDGNQNTQIVHNNDRSKYWVIKPHLSIETRIERGFSLLPSSNLTSLVREPEEEKFEYQEEEEEEEEEDECEEPEWLHEPMQSLPLSDLHTIPAIQLVDPVKLVDPIQLVDSALPDCLRFITEDVLKEAFAASQMRKSYFDSHREQLELHDDYDDIMRDLQRAHRLMQIMTF